MSRRNARILMLLGIMVMIPACSFPFDQSASSAPVGAYECYGHEFGMLAFTGLLQIDPDGDASFLGNTGQWIYDDETETFAFSGDLPLVLAEYDADLAQLNVTLQPDVTIAHAELGVMTCNLRSE